MNTYFTYPDNDTLRGVGADEVGVLSQLTSHGTDEHVLYIPWQWYARRSGRRWGRSSVPTEHAVPPPVWSSAGLGWACPFFACCLTWSHCSVTALPSAWSPAPGSGPLCQTVTRVFSTTCSSINKKIIINCPHRLTFTWWDVAVYVFGIGQHSLATPFYSVLVSISVFMARSTVFHFINSPNNSLLSHSVLPVLFLT